MKMMPTFFKTAKDTHPFAFHFPNLFQSESGTETNRTSRGANQRCSKDLAGEKYISRGPTMIGFLSETKIN